MNWVFTAPYPELQEALEAAQQTVLLRDKKVVGRRMLDEYEYPFRTIIDDDRAQVMVFPDLWDGMLGWSKHKFNRWRNHNNCIFVGCQYTSDAVMPSNCRAFITDAHVGLYTDASLAASHAAEAGRAAIWRPGESVTPLLAAVRDVQQRKPYAAGRAARQPYRNV